VTPFPPYGHDIIDECPRCKLLDFSEILRSNHKRYYKEVQNVFLSRWKFVIFVTFGSNWFALKWWQNLWRGIDDLTQEELRGSKCVTSEKIEGQCFTHSLQRRDAQIIIYKTYAWRLQIKIDLI